MISYFRDQWLEDFFRYGRSSNVFPSNLETALARKLDIIRAATSHSDRQYRLVFRWTEGKAEDLYLSTQVHATQSEASPMTLQQALRKPTTPGDVLLSFG
ncbi:type II toxin-antitoxin system RelE/ParE family toxin [Enterobacter chengduensis]|uniref:type II toxin-antitoxin system RelE/ParE family toxin n=1 Tax=Enterobacter chengduensis TaxID=2494701 RepID=UPI003211B892